MSKRYSKWHLGFTGVLSLCLWLGLQANAQQRTGGGGGGFGGGGGTRTGSTSSTSAGSTVRQYPNNTTIGDAYFSIDPETRRIVYITDEATAKALAQVLTNLDRPKPQVLIKVVFVEVTHENDSDIGLEGGWGNSIGNNASASAVNGYGLTQLSSVVGSNFNQFGQPTSSFAAASPMTASGAGLYQILGQDYQVTLRAIAQAGHAKVLSRPSILARNNQPATIQVGQNVPLISSVSYNGLNGTPINAITYQSVGVILKVTPFITADNMVEMIIAPTISSIDPTLSIPISAGVNAPVIDIRSADTVAVTGDGQTVVIGGLLQDSKSQTDTKIPLLGDIPLLGNLFKRTQKSTSKDELIIFLTPHIVQTPGELAALSSRERVKSDAIKGLSEDQLDHFLDTLPAKKPAGTGARKPGENDSNSAGMEMRRRSLFAYGLLAALWALVLAWQAEEHFRVSAVARADLTNRSKDIANTVSACIRGMQFHGTVSADRLEPVLNELVYGRSNELVQSSELISIALLNATNRQVISAGRPIDYTQADLMQEGERWGQHTVTFVNPVDLGASVLPSRQELTNAFPELPRPRPFARPEPPPGPPPENFNAAPPNSTNALAANPGPRPEREGRPRGRPPWLRGLGEREYQSLMEQGALHGLVLVMSTESFQAADVRDLWLRAIIVFLAAVSAAGSGLAWRNLAKTSELQIRLVRASELNTHLKEMNLAAAGLAHETRNPLNIIRGLAQMISKQPDTAPEIRQKSRDIVDEADKVAAQLNEFINYSRPREVRRSVLPLSSVVNEVVRALNYDLEEKKIQLQIKGEHLSIEADEQLLRQALFNLLLNAVQAVNGSGEIQVLAERRSASEAVLEVRDNGPGVPPERRSEIFKPYFTTQKTGTGLGLAVVQQIVLAHGWEIECLPNEPQGAIFRISHLKLMG